MNYNSSPKCSPWVRGWCRSAFRNGWLGIMTRGWDKRLTWARSGLR